MTNLLKEHNKKELSHYHMHKDKIQYRLDISFVDILRGFLIPTVVIIDFASFFDLQNSINHARN